MKLIVVESSTFRSMVQFGCVQTILGVLAMSLTLSVEGEGDGLHQRRTGHLVGIVSR